MLAKNQLPILSQALFSGQANAVLCTLSQNERPLQGASGLIDWKFHGAFTDLIRSGKISGAPDEFTYVLKVLAGKPYHFFVVGIGNSPAPGARAKLPVSLIAKAAAKIKKTKVTGLLISLSDFGLESPDPIQKEMEGIELCITQ